METNRVYELQEADRKLLEVFEIDALQRSCRVSKLEKVRNVIIKQRICLKNTIVEVTERRQIIWYGHVMQKKIVLEIV